MPTLTEDKLVTSLVPDPSDVPNLKMKSGWLGKSPRRGYWRLYLTPILNNYLEFREEDIVHTVSLESNINPFGGTSVFLKREADFFQTCTTSTQTQAEWLRGDILRRHLRRTGINGLVAPGTTEFPTTIIVTTTIIILVVATFIVCDGDGNGGGGDTGCAHGAPCATFGSCCC